VRHYPPLILTLLECATFLRSWRSLYTLAITAWVILETVTFLLFLAIFTALFGVRPCTPQNLLAVFEQLVVDTGRVSRAG